MRERSTGPAVAEVRPSPARAPWLPAAVAALLALQAAVQFLSIRQETQTWDEAIELVSGYVYLKTGDYRLEQANPPLAKMVAALPLLVLNPSLPLDDRSWREGEPRRFADLFMWRNRVAPDTMLFAARSMMILLNLGLGLAVAWWMQRYFGAVAAIVAVALLCLDPNVIAHGRYIKNDVPSALVGFLAVAAWGEYLVRPGLRRLALAGLLLGLACAVKLSGIALFPVFGLLFVVRWWQAGRLPANPLAAASAGLLAASVLAVLYWPEAARCLANRPDGVPALVRPRVDLSTASGRALSRLGETCGCPDHALLAGLSRLATFTRGGHEAYLLGMRSSNGWWYYFPVAFAVKTPVAALALMVVACAIAFSWLALAGLPECARRLRGGTLAPFLLGIPLAAHTGLALASPINIGLRYLLPAYPFLFATIGALLASRPWHGRVAVTAVLVVGAAVESLSVFPHYLAFFNWLSGGPEAGSKYLVDSNLDWGQDLKKLKTWMVAHQVPQVCLCYFGTAAPSMYGIDFRDMVLMQDTEQETRGCVTAVSVTPLKGLFLPEHKLAWLRDRRPDAKVGYSIFIFDRRSEAAPPPGR